MNNDGLRRKLTVGEFETQRHQLSCQHCGHVGLVAEHNANNGGTRPACPICESRSPLSGVSWLPRTTAKTPKRGVVETSEVWTENGNHCAFCGKSRALCERLGIGLSAQHVVPFTTAGDDWPLIPFCARCQQASTAALAETRRVESTIGGLDEIIARIEKQNPELRG